MHRALEREGAASVNELVRRLDADPGARRRFRMSVAVSVSGLFRDPAQFELLERTLLPPLLAGGRRITVWSAGCANGTELYSLAIVLQRLGALERAHLLGSDLLEENLAEARRLVLCRNLAIYLAPAARHALHETLAGALAPGGVLLLGRSERLTRPEALGLESVAPHAYRRAS